MMMTRVMMMMLMSMNMKGRRGDESRGLEGVPGVAHYPVIMMKDIEQDERKKVRKHQSFSAENNVAMYKHTHETVGWSKWNQIPIKRTFFTVCIGHISQSQLHILCSCALSGPSRVDNDDDDDDDDDDDTEDADLDEEALKVVEVVEREGGIGSLTSATATSPGRRPMVTASAGESDARGSLACCPRSKASIALSTTRVRESPGWKEEDDDDDDTDDVLVELERATVGDLEGN